nr:DarT ssDNA thymidine ADP-ribosyltransferase family protein [uncultured Desulfobacter sp.]
MEIVIIFLVLCLLWLMPCIFLGLIAKIYIFFTKGQTKQFVNKVGSAAVHASDTLNDLAESMHDYTTKKRISDMTRRREKFLAEHADIKNPGPALQALLDIDTENFKIETEKDNPQSEWMNDLWRWADEHEIEECNIPRNKSDLLNLESLSFGSICYLEKKKFSRLPKEIGQLTNLKFLELGSVTHPEILLNQLTELPKEIGNLTGLTRLYLQDNSLTELPNEIGKLSKLEQLKLGFNHLVRLPKEIGQLKELNLLTVWSNNLTELPKEIGLLTNLVGLDISRNPITILPDEIINLTGLKKFYFDCENIEFNKLQYEWLSELKSNGCELSPDFLNFKNNRFVSEQPIDSPPFWIDEVPPCDEVPPWMEESSFWVSDNELIAINESFKFYGVTSLWHMTHIDNIESIFSKGILSNNQAFINAKPVDISDHNVQRWRGKKDPIYGRELHDYVPTYFNIKNPMLSAKRDIENSICLIEISLSVLSVKDFIFTDGNAASQNTIFYRLISDLQRLPWNVLSAAYWNDLDDGKRKRCAEMLIYPIIPPEYIKKIYCSSYETLKRLSAFPVESEISETLFFNNHRILNRSFSEDIPF